MEQFLLKAKPNSWQNDGYKEGKQEENYTEAGRRGWDTILHKPHSWCGKPQLEENSKPGASPEEGKGLNPTSGISTFRNCR